MKHIVKLSQLAVATIFLGGAPLLYAADPLGSVNIEVSALVVGDGCSAIIDGPDMSSIDLGELPLVDIQKSIGHKGKATELDIRFTCEGGKKAKWSMQLNSPKCEQKTLGNWWFVCGGQNKTVGLKPVFVYIDGDGLAKYVEGKGDMNEKLFYTLKLDDKGVGVISVKKVEYARLRDVEPLPGPLAASYTLTVWAD